MKRLFVSGWLAVALSISSVQAQGPLYTIDWDWETTNTVSANGTVYFMPWFIGGLTDVPYEIGADHLKDDGWMLLWSNFDGHMVDGNGQTVNVPDNQPFFALYNRFRGVARFFYIHLNNSSSSDLLHGLTFEGLNNGETSLLNYTFEFADPTNETPIRPFYTRANFSQLGTSGPAQGHWFYMDVELAYDDVTGLTAGDLVMRWLGRGVNTTNLNISGTQTGSIVGSIDIAGSNGSFLNLANTLNFNSSNKVTVTNSISGNNASGTKVDSKADAQKSPFLKTKFKDLANKLFGQAANLVSGGLGDLVNSLIGGGEKDSSPQQNVNLRLQTEITLSGTLTSTSNLFERTLKVPGTSHTSSTQAIIPQYDEPLGLIAIPQRPKVIWNEWFEYEDRRNRYIYYQDYDLDNNNPVQVVLNPAVSSDLQITNVTVELVFMEKYTGDTNLRGPDELGNRIPNNIYGGSLIVHTDDDKAYAGLGISTRYNYVSPAPWSEWEAGEYTFGVDNRFLVRVMVELERLDINDADPVVWSKTFVPEFCKGNIDPIREVRDIVDEEGGIDE